MRSPFFWTLSEARFALQSKQISSWELTELCLKRLESMRSLGCFITETPDIARAQACASDARRARGESSGALEGIPLAHKDLFCTKGVRTTAGSQILSNFVPPYESFVTERLKKCGSVLLGKLNQDAFGMGSATQNEVFGNCRNPWSSLESPSVPGGSSGGSAASVSAGLAFAATGTDTGGSVRQPAAFCGVVGIKPSYGRCSRRGIIAYASSLDQAGVVTRSVRDAAIVLREIAGHDPLDMTCATHKVPDYEKILEKSLNEKTEISAKKIRIGMARDYQDMPLSASAREQYERSAELLRVQGAEIVTSITMPHLPFALPSYYIIAPAEASSNLARYDGVRYGVRAKSDSLGDLYNQSRAEGFSAEVRRRILIGSYVLSAGYYDAYYIKAQKIRALIRSDFAKAFEQCDVLLAPVTPDVAFSFAECARQTPVSAYAQDMFTVPASLAGLPAISLPVGFGDSGLPLGVQLIAPSFEEGRLLAVAAKLEQAAEFKYSPSLTEFSE